MEEEESIFEQLLTYSEEIEENISEDYFEVVEKISNFVNKIKQIDKDE